LLSFTVPIALAEDRPGLDADVHAAIALLKATSPAAAKLGPNGRIISPQGESDWVFVAINLVRRTTSIALFREPPTIRLPQVHSCNMRARSSSDLLLTSPS